MANKRKFVTGLVLLSCVALGGFYTSIGAGPYSGAATLATTASNSGQAALSGGGQSALSGGGQAALADSGGSGGTLLTVTKVTDGDSLRSGEIRIRIFGIDAPEIRQNCLDAGGRAWTCGVRAKQAMASLVAGHDKVRCEYKDTDRYKRLVMRCHAGGTDLGLALVRAGLALAERRFSKDYIEAETRARHDGVGMWAGTFLPPWEWRRANK